MHLPASIHRNLRLHFAAFLVATLLCTLISQAAPPQRITRMKKIPANPKLFDGNPPRHIGDYPTFKIAWQPEPKIRDVTAVFPHPFLSRRIVLTTLNGLLLSDDNGKTWNDLPGTAPATIGPIRHVEFALNSDTLYLASAEKGVWQISDLTKPPQQIATKAKGLLSDAVTQVRLDTADPLGKTLVAVHGADAGGISRSLDSGRTWSPILGMQDYYIEKLYPGGPGVPWAFAIASLKDPSAAKGVFFCHTIGDFLKEYAAEIQANDGAIEILFRRPFAEVNDLAYWATDAGGILKTDHDGTNSQRIGPEDVDKWASVGLTWGPTADSRIIYGYAPQKLGFAVSQDDGQTFTPFSEGLPTGRFVKQGAQVKADAGGSTFFAAINGSLYIGRRYTGNITISDINVSPISLSFQPIRYIGAFNDFRKQLDAFRTVRGPAAAAPETLEKAHALEKLTNAMSFSISAKIIAAADDAADNPPASQPARPDLPASITVDLSRVGGPAAAPMFDDGLHADGAPNDGVFGATCMLRPDRMRNVYQDIRRPTPGPMALTITAIAPDGSLSSAVGVAGFLEQPESHTYWAPTIRDQWKDAEGGITVGVEEPPGDRRCIKISTTDKPWSIPLINPYNHSALGYTYLSFYIKTDGPAPADIFVQLKDFSRDTVPALTVRVPVLKEHLIEGGAINQEYHRVVVPFSLLFKDPPAGVARFRPPLLRAVVISADAAAPTHYWITSVRFHTDDQDVKASAAPGARE